MPLTKEQKSARRKQKQAEWKAEVQQLYRKRDEMQSNEQERNARYFKKKIEAEERLLEAVYEKLRSAEFKAWYEATTGEAVDVFLEEMIISQDEYIRRFRSTSLIRVTQLEWIKTRIEWISAKNPWTDPEKKHYWAERVQNATDPRDRRIILMKLATPRWADKEKMIAMYRERDRLTLETGIPHDVDHIVPIVNRHVCGLHCEFNLRVITATENRSKSNSFNGVCERI